MEDIIFDLNSIDPHAQCRHIKASVYVSPLINAYEVIQQNSAVIDKISYEEIARSVVI